MKNWIHGVPHEDLDREVQRIRRLARGLCFEHAADDAAQEAWLAALRSSGEPPRSLAAWLAGTVRNIVAAERRSGARRREREIEVAQPASSPSAGEAAEQIEVLQRLLSSLESLDEPYRSTLVLRFLEDKSPREIARREGRSVNTVRTHVRRGLCELRRRLSQGDRDRRDSFLAGLVLFAAKPAWITLTLPTSSNLTNWSGGVVLKGSTTKLALGIALALALVAGVLHWMDVGGKRAGDGSVASAPLASLDRPEGDSAVADDRVEGALTEGAERSLASVERSATSDWVVRGQTYLSNTGPFPGATVLARLHAGNSASGELIEEAHLQSDALGEFAWYLPGPTERVTLSLSISGVGLEAYPEVLTVPRGDEPPQNIWLSASLLDVTLLGRVLDPEHHPIEGARVIQGRTEARTNGEGRYRLEASSRSGTQVVQARAENLAVGQVATRVGGPGEHDIPDIVLAPGVRLRGKIVDGRNKPAPGVEVAVWLHDEIHTKTDVDGFFVLEGLDPRNGEADLQFQEVWLRATRAGLCEQGRKVEADELAAGELEWILQSGTPVRGHVRDRLGAPVAGAWVCIGYSPDATPRVDAWTEEDGSFEFPLVQASATGSNLLWACRKGFRSAKRVLEIPDSGSAIEGVQVVLEAGHSLGGRVHDEAGEPIHGAYVYAKGSEEWWAPAVHTDREGRFRLEGLPSEPIAVGCMRHGYLRWSGSVLPSDRDDLEIQLEACGQLAGKVIDGVTGAPIESFRIRFTDANPGPGETAVSKNSSGWSASGSGVPYVDSGGYWHIGDGVLHCGHVVGIEAIADGYAPTIANHIAVSLNPDPDEVVLALSRGARIEGRILATENGAPVVDALIRAFLQRAPWGDEDGVLLTHTDELGRFTLECVPAWKLSLCVDHPEFARKLDGPFEVPTSGVVQRFVSLDHGGSVSGVLRDFDGVPLADEEIGLDALEVPGARGGEVRTHTDAFGEYAFRNLMPGVYKVGWEQSVGGMPVRPVARLLRISGQETAAVDLRPTGSARVWGSIGAAVPIPDVISVDLMPTDRAHREAALYQAAAERGRFLFDHVEPGRYTLKAESPGLRGYTEVVVPEGGEIEVSLQLVGFGR